jgi:hypothetical protein
MLVARSPPHMPDARRATRRSNPHLIPIPIRKPPAHSGRRQPPVRPKRSQVPCSSGAASAVVLMGAKVSIGTPALGEREADERALAPSHEWSTHGRECRVLRMREPTPPPVALPVWNDFDRDEPTDVALGRDRPDRSGARARPGSRFRALGFSRTLVGGSFSSWQGQGESGEVDRLLAGGAAAGPAAQQRLEQQDCLGERQAGRWRFGSARSRVRNPCAAITSAQW